ncbi:MAG TPA: hypothetical protein VH391_09845 [Solirubrobacterales bacterium]
MQSRKIAVGAAVGALVVAVVLFIVLSGGSGSDDGEKSQTFAFQLADGRAVGGEQEVSATQGDDLTVTLRTDVPAELHVHGYEKSTDVKAGGQGSVAFTADITGEFEVEAHRLVHGEEGPGISLATLTVNP